MAVAREELITHLRDQRNNTAAGIQARLDALNGAVDLQDESLAILDELSQLAAGYRLYRDLLDRLNDIDDVVQAYSGLMAARLASVDTHEDHYLRELGAEAYFAGLGPSVGKVR